MMLSDAQGDVLVEIAREEVSVRLGDRQRNPRDEEWLREDRATFVTITRDGDLRGCIGSLTAHSPLVEDVRRNAVAAALQDRRFSPMVEEELPSVRFEVSVLTPMIRLEVDDQAELITRLEPEVDGVFLSDRGRSSTFLPQVWKSLPEPEDFLRSLRVKAGLPGNYWSDTLEIFTYQVQKFEEQ